MHHSPLVVAHRGSSYTHPEHTLAAYTQAIDEGADGLECDVRLTSDGHLVCVHDRRLDRTSDGRGVVSTRTLADLAGLDFGSWHSRDYQGVLTLERLLEVVVSAGRPVKLFVETKHPTRYGGLVEQELVKMLHRFGLGEPADPDGSAVCVMSFAPAAIRRIRLLAGAVPTVLLMDRVPPFRRDGSLPTGVTWAGPDKAILAAHPRYVARVHRAGGKVYAWTVDEPAEVSRLVALGVDAIATNRPGEVLRQLARL
jgi:glycerophosphoryl diester phosphodiesterase